MKKEMTGTNTHGMPLIDDVLEHVIGGASETEAQSKAAEFFAAWDNMGFPFHGFSDRNKMGMCDQWEAEGFPGTATQWLSKYKTW